VSHPEDEAFEVWWGGYPMIASVLDAGKVWTLGQPPLVLATDSILQIRTS